jgi:nitrite reductase/ring-hydroxylating ferredoxin subunit
VADENWVRVLAEDELTEGKILAVEVGERELALYRLSAEEVCATDNICTHEYARLCEGWLSGEVIECPLHAGQFDIRTGKAVLAPAEHDLETFPVKVESGNIYVSIKP